MTKYLLYFLPVFFALSAKAQVYKSFIDKQGRLCDSANASSFILYSAGSDSLLHVREYSLEGNMLTKGTYKDPKMQTPHGLFTFYSKGDSGRYFTSQRGLFIDGQKEGIWTEYFSNSNRKVSANFKNGKNHGEFRSYNFQGDLSSKGHYKDGYKEGEWISYDRYDNEIQISVYKNGKFVSNIKRPPVYLQPAVSEKFESYIKNSIKKLIPSEDRSYGLFLIGSSLSENGVISKSSIVTTFGGAVDFSKDVLGILAQSPAWKPAYNEKEKKDINDSVQFVIRYSKLGISTELHRYSLHRSNADWDSLSIMPMPRGGMESFYQHLSTSISVPKEFKQEIRKTLVVGFIVDTDGSLSEFKVLRSLGHGLDEEVLRTLKHSPKWFPAIRNGKLVRVQFTLPIKFEIEQKSEPADLPNIQRY